MSKQTFEDNFPSFDPMRHPEAALLLFDKRLRRYLEKHCLSKQRVKEVIEKCKITERFPEQQGLVNPEELLKELGLEDNEQEVKNERD